jgi:hypothetical protein
VISEQFSFYGVRLLASRTTPNLEAQLSLFVWLLPLDRSGMGNPTSSYATARIPHYHDKVETAVLSVFS